MEKRIVFTEVGWKRLERIRAEQAEKVRLAGLEVGEEAGPNCDWHDNFGYEEARRRLEQESLRLQQWNDILRRGEIIQIVEQDNIVSIGNTVSASIGGALRTFTIGAYGETDSKQSLVSYDSPIAQLVLGCQLHETKDSFFQGKEIEVTILDIKKPSQRYVKIVEQYKNDPL